MNNDDSGSVLYCAGMGLSVSYRLRSRVILAAGFSRSRLRVWGSNGGDAGRTNQLRVLRKDGTSERRTVVCDLVQEPGDELVIETAYGGGWGRKPANSKTKYIPKREEINAT